ncbi:MAG: PAS domain-containing protein [Candidatus Marinimicrobia bacterium]|nr:PAS domain-containing protein [Candidatus Neomarinimicrobiota bacterium]
MINEPKSYNSTLLKDYITTVTLLENISDGIFILNDHGKIQYTNNSATNMLHTDEGHLIGRFFDDFLINLNNQKDKKEKTQQNLLDKLNEGIFSNIETTLINNNHEVPVIINVNLINDSNNNHPYLIVTAKDISHWKNLEKELQEQQALSISRDRLKLIGELSVGLVHEITQPLLALKMRSELLKNKLDRNEITRQEVNNNFEQIFELITRIEKTIGNVRDYAHQTEDETITDICVDQVILEAMRLIEYELTENCIRFEIFKENEIPTISTNKIMLEQVFLNILKNSIDSIKVTSFSDGEEKNIKVFMRAREDKWVEILIEDNGKSIDIEIVEKIFDPFFTTKNFKNNSGLGLTISRNVINSLGGDIKLATNAENKKQFAIQLPVIQKDEQEQLFNFIEMLNQV